MTAFMHHQVLEKMRSEHRLHLNSHDHDHIQYRVAAECRELRDIRHRDQVPDEQHRHNQATRPTGEARDRIGSGTNKRKAPEELENKVVPPFQASSHQASSEKAQRDAKILSSAISAAKTTEQLLYLATTNRGCLNVFHLGNLWNKLGRQHDT